MEIKEVINAEVFEDIEVVDAVNLTPHKLNIRADDGFIVSIPPMGDVARCATKENAVKKIYIRGFEGHPITVNKTTFGDPSGVPEVEEGKIYLTSTIVKEAARRDDVMAPGKGLRNEDGQVYAASGLACV